MKKSSSSPGYRYYDLILGSFVTILLCSNLIGAAKVAQVGTFTFGAGVLFFPLSYIFGDILTEVYGYARARRIVWAGFAALIFSSLMASVVVALPHAPSWPNQGAYETVYGQTPRIVLASLIAFCCGEFANSYVLAKMKIWSKGKKLWMRTIGSTVVGEAVDSLLFYPIAFWGAWGNNQLVMNVMFTNYLIKSGWEILITPFTYLAVNWLKKAEGIDYYDYKTNFSPFKLSDE